MVICRILACSTLLAAPAGAELLKTPVWSEAPPHAFEVLIDGEPVPVRSVQTPDDELVLLLVMDVVKRADRVDAARDAIVRKLTELGPKYYAGILSAQDGLEVRQDPTRGRGRLRRKLEELDVRGVPGLLDVIEQTSQIADRTQIAANVRLAVLFLTDGEIEDYRGDYTIPVVNPSDGRDLSRRFGSQLILERIRSTVDALESAQVPLFFLHLARQYDDLNEVYQNGISEFARVTGGTALFAQGLQEVPALVNQVLDEIAGHSVVSIELDCSGLHQLEVIAGQNEVRHVSLIGCPSPGS